MPAINPRISVTVPPSIEAVLSRLSQLTGQSKSAFIAEILETSLPVFERMVTVIEAAQQAKDTLKAKTVKDMEDAESRLHQLLGVTMDIFDQASLPILQEAERVNRRAARAPAVVPAQRARRAVAAQRPPHVTRGSGTPQSAKGAESEGQKQHARRSGLKNVPAKAPKTLQEAKTKKSKG